MGRKIREYRYEEEQVLCLYQEGCSIAEIIERLSGNKYDNVYLSRMIKKAGISRSPKERVQLAFRRQRVPRPSGERHWKYKGGQKDNGYVLVYQGKGKYARRNRLVWESVHGPLPEGFEVHHLNGIKDDDRPENLVALSKKGHTRVYLRLLEQAQKRVRVLEARLRGREQQLELSLGKEVG